LDQKKEARATAKEQRDIALYGERIKKLRTDTTDYQKQIEETQKKIADIEKANAEVAPAYKEVSPGNFVKEEYQANEYSEAQDLYKSKQSLRQGNQATLQNEKYKKQLEQLQRKEKIQIYANKKGIPTNELVSKFDRFEQISQEVEGNPDKYISGVILDQNKRKQALLDIINKRAASEIGIDIDDVEKILNIKIK